MIPVYEELPIDDDTDDSDLVETDEDDVEPGLTWRLDPDTHTITSVMIDDLDAVKQAVWMMLQTMRGEYEIYSEDYGTEIYDLIGDSVPLAYVEVKNDIIDTLTTDDRIDDVTDFEFYNDSGDVIVTFTVVTNIGEEFESGVILNGGSD